MYAGNHINFIEPFITQNDRDPREPAVELGPEYKALLYKILMKHREALRILSVGDDDGGAEDHFELVLRIVAEEDGSYLHISIHGSNLVSETDMEMRINISEHNSAGMTQRSYSYVEDEGAVRRVDNEDRELLGDYHYSHIDLINSLVELYGHRQSEWDADKKLASDAFEMIDNFHANATLEYEMGLNNLAIDRRELENLSIILEKGIPIPEEG